jgi:hypothetical protein
MKSNNNYDVQIDSDVLDDVRIATIQDSNTVTCGRLTLDGVEQRWKIGDGEWSMTIPSGIWSVIDLLINESQDFRSRADANDIYDAVVSALQERHHPEHCGCRDCDECFDENRKEALGGLERQELRELGLLDVEPALIDDGEDITVEDVLGAPRKAESESELRKLGL